MAMPELIHKLRTGAKLSQEQFAALFHVSRQSVQKWESGLVTPELSKVIEISKYFGVSLDALILGRDNRTVEEMYRGREVKPEYSKMADWEFYPSNILTEYEQSVDEGLDVEMYQDLFAAVSRLPKDETKKKLGDVLFEIVKNAGTVKNYPYTEPSTLPEIRALRKEFPIPLAVDGDRLEEKTGKRDEALIRETEENALLYAEHTWGHSSTITNPYDTIVTNLDIRKNSYASKAHEAAAMRKTRQCHLLGDILRYYNLSGKVKAVSVSGEKRVLPVEFYVETMSLPAVKVTDAKTGEAIPVQLSAHPRGVLVSFLAEFGPMEEKEFFYEEQPAPEATLYTRTAWVGAERVRDIVNTYDPESYRLPYGMENRWFSIRWKIGEGITSFYNKRTGAEMLLDGPAKFFTPVYERTQIRRGVYEERRLLGRNIRGQHAQRFQGKLREVKVLDHGPVFTRTELVFDLEGTYHSSVLIKLYKGLPRIEFAYRIAKTLSEDIESVYLPLALDLPEAEVYIRNGGVPMRPGVDQLPGSNMEYYIADQGLLYRQDGQSVLVNTLDTPLLSMGEMRHHPIVLCDNRPENNRRPVYSWIMNNTWETNFKMDLSGFGEFQYSLELAEGTTLEQDLMRLEENDMGVVTFING